MVGVEIESVGISNSRLSEAKGIEKGRSFIELLDGGLVLVDPRVRWVLDDFMILIDEIGKDGL